MIRSVVGDSLVTEANVFVHTLTVGLLVYDRGKKANVKCIIMTAVRTPADNAIDLSS